MVSTGSEVIQVGANLLDPETGEVLSVVDSIEVLAEQYSSLGTAP